MNYNKRILEEQHFCSSGHNVNRNIKFTIIERIEKTYWAISWQLWNHGNKKAFLNTDISSITDLLWARKTLVAVIYI